MSSYSNNVLQHFFQPHGVGLLAAENAILQACVSSTATGTLQLQIQVGADEKISQARFKAHGCPATIACGSWLTLWLTGKFLGEAEKLTSGQIVDALELTSEKIHCAMMAEDAVKAVVAQYRNK